MVHEIKKKKPVFIIDLTGEKVHVEIEEKEEQSFEDFLKECEKEREGIEKVDIKFSEIYRKLKIEEFLDELPPFLRLLFLPPMNSEQSAPDYSPVKVGDSVRTTEAYTRQNHEIIEGEVVNIENRRDKIGNRYFVATLKKQDGELRYIGIGWLEKC